MLNEATRGRIEAVLREQFGPALAEADVVSRPDADGDPAIYIRVQFAPGYAIPESAKLVDASVVLRDTLLAADDHRFPYLRPVYPEEPVSDEAA